MIRCTRYTRCSQRSFIISVLNRFLMKATHLQQAATIEETLLGNAVVPFTNDGEHHYSIKENKTESKMLALFDKQIIISLSDTDHITQIQNSFLSVVLTANIQLDKKFEKIDESYKDVLILFVGLKTGSNLITEYTIYHRVTDFCLLFPKDARVTTCFENPCYQNMQVTTCGRNFPDMHVNTLDQQFFQLQLNASNFDLLFEATDEFEDALTTPRNIATRGPNPNTDLTSFLINLQCERNSNGVLTFDGLDTQNQNTSVELKGAPIYQGATDSYYNVDTSGKRPSSPILCIVHDTFWLFSPTAGGSCTYDTNHSFDEAIGPLSS
ncbi:MAG: hypothetical protein EZS28_009653 [Streblomastix strix]|uniref:Uncharacterized protein n=1 Tax=Streblomastix strix TaxID=222440 RepID=A0A5J4WIR6_9EUKA|nr:MAG: hypothetical protein EZS28_009653 [Streblomastix strix]